MKTVIIVNPHAGSGRVGKLWKEIEPILRQELGDLVVGVTQHPEEVAQYLEEMRTEDTGRVIAVGGDGTNHTLINEIMSFKERYPDMSAIAFGSIPIGTGQDWARTTGTPDTPIDAIHWLKNALPTPLDVGRIRFKNGDSRYFLNIASAGIGGVIAERINQRERRSPWAFYLGSLQALLSYRPALVKIKLDGELWYEGKTFAIVAANGQVFGHGMRVAPNAVYDDGLFDVILIQGMPPLRAITALNSVYSAAHLKRADVQSARARCVEIDAGETIFPVEMDGENHAGPPVEFDVLPGALNVLINKKGS